MSLDVEINSKQYSLVPGGDGTKVSTRPVQQFVQPIRDTGRTRPEDVAAYESFVVPNLAYGFGRARINSDVAFDPKEYRRFFNSTCDTRWMDRVYLPILAETAGKDHSSTDTTDMSVVKNSTSFRSELQALWTGPGGTVLNKRFTGASTNAWENGGLVYPDITKAAAHYAAASSYTISVAIPTGTNLFVAVLMGTNNDSIGTDDAASTAIAGDAMTKVVTNAEGNNAIQIWYKTSPTTGTQNFTTSWRAEGGGVNDIDQPSFAFYSIQGADTSAISVASASSDMSSTTGVSNTVTTAIGDIVIDGYAVNDNVTNTAGADQLLASLLTDNSSFTHVSTLKIATTTSTTMTHTMSEAESGCSAAAAFAIRPSVPLDITSDRGNLVALVANSSNHLVVTSSDADNSTWTVATTQITSSLGSAPTVDQNIDGGLFATIGGELIACLHHSGTGVTFFRSTNGGVAWADEAVDIPSANGPQGVAVYPDIDGEDKLYVGTNEGLYIVDTSPSTWTYQLIMPMSNSTDNCRRMTVHEGSLWFAQGVDNDSPAPIYKLTVQGNSRIIESGFGLSYGDGVPDDMLGPVRWMKSAGDQLFISVGGGDSGRNARILAWNGKGWHHMYKNSSANQNIDWIDVGSGDDGTPRLHFAERTATSTAVAKFLAQPLVNPRSGVSIKRAADGQFIELPYYDLGMPHNSKNFLTAHLSADDLTASHETVEFHYGLNGADRDTTDLGDFTSSVSKIDFASGAGVSAKDIGIMLKLNRNDSTNTNTPKIKDIIIEGAVVPSILYEHQMTIDIEQTAEDTGQSIETVISNIESLVESVIQTQFKFGAVSKYVTLDRERSGFSFGINSWDAGGAPNALAERTGTFNCVLVEKVAS